MRIGDILLEKLKFAEQSPEALVAHYKAQSKEEYKKREFAIQCFQKRVNGQLELNGYKGRSFGYYKLALYALTEVSDLRWFWKYCQENGNKFDKNKNKYTFSRIFFSSLDTKKK